jgi:hypothetical protein
MRALTLTLWMSIVDPADQQTIWGAEVGIAGDFDAGPLHLRPEG